MTRTNVRSRNARGERRDEGRARSSMTYGPIGRACRAAGRGYLYWWGRAARGAGRTFRVRHASSGVARHDAPLIDERAATRWRRAAEGGDEDAGAKGAIR